MLWHTLLSLLLLGTLLKSIQKNTFLFDTQAYTQEADSLFAAATLEMKEKIRLQDSFIARYPSESQARTQY